MPKPEKGGRGNKLDPVSSSLTAEWQPIGTAPRDGSCILVRRAPGRLARRRKHHEHIVRWDASQYRPVWRSYTENGRLFQDEQLLGWRPLDLAAQLKLQQRAEKRKRERLITT